MSSEEWALAEVHDILAAVRTLLRSKEQT